MLGAMPDWKKLFDTATEQVGEGMKIAGAGLKQAAGEAKKVAGIGVGTITVESRRSSYELGDTIDGTVRLQLTEPIPAKRLVVTLRATRKRYVAQRASDGRVAPVQRSEVLVDHEVELDGERSYDSGVHQFEVRIPARIDAKVDVGGKLGDLLSAAQTIKSMTESPIRWELVAFLDIPWKRNLSKETDLSVHE